MSRAVLAGLAVIALGVQSQAASPAKKPRPPSSVEIDNQRKVALDSFVLSTMEAQDRPVAKLAKPLAPGGKLKLKIVRAKGCEFVARWKFEDAGDEAQVDLCNDPKIVLTD